MAPAGPLRWESALTISDLTMALHASGLQTPSEWSSVEVARRSESGRVLTLRMSGGSSTPVLVSASSFRYAVGRALGWNKIRSDLYDVRAGNGAVTFSGRGSGHGVGLCQAGAEQMGLQGKSYQEILAFYFPGTQISLPAGPEWQRRFSDRFELESVAPDQDSLVLPMAARILEDDERVAGWKIRSRVRLQVFPTLDAYRDTTGQPGWVAASTRGSTIRLQPLKQLRSRSVLESTLRHELFHILVESQAAPTVPLWFREGLVLFLSGEITSAHPSVSLKDSEVEAILHQPLSREEMERAYAAAYARVSDLIAREGHATVLGWLSHGLPADFGGAL